MPPRQQPAMPFYCPWCFHPVVHVGGFVGFDRYDCTGKPSHIVIVMTQQSYQALDQLLDQLPKEPL